MIEGEGNVFERANVKDYKLPLITPFSKRQALYKDNGPVKLRKNIVVVGDIIEDARMVRSSQHDVILRVGMLVNAKKPEHLVKQIKSFKQTFDLIIAGDGSFCPLVDTLRIVCGQEPQQRDIEALHGLEELQKLFSEISR